GFDPRRELGDALWAGRGEVLLLQRVVLQIVKVVAAVGGPVQLVRADPEGHEGAVPRADARLGKALLDELQELDRPGELADQGVRSGDGRDPANARQRDRFGAGRAGGPLAAR